MEQKYVLKSQATGSGYSAGDLAPYENYNGTLVLTGTAKKGAAEALGSLSYKLVRIGNAVNMQLPSLPSVALTTTGTIEALIPSQFRSASAGSIRYLNATVQGGTETLGQILFNTQSGLMQFSPVATSDNFSFPSGNPVGWDQTIVSWSML